MPIQPPYGDIFTFQTPYLDRASQQLYKEQQDREAYKRKQNESIDNEFKAMLPGIRTGDTEKFAELYNDYKTSWQQLHNKPPQNQKEYLQAQQDLLKKKAAMYNHVTNSKLKAAEERAIGTSIMGDKNGMYRDDAHEILAQGMQLPYDKQIDITDPQTGQKIKSDWTNPDALKRHIDTKSVMDAVKFSTGADQKYSGDRFKEKPTDLDYVQPEITVKNKPTQFYDNMKLAATKDPVSFLNTLPHPTPDEYFNVETHYNQVMTPEVKNSWRMAEGEDLPPDDNLTDLERAIKYQAMTHALNNLPRSINKRVPAETGERMAKAHEYSQSNIRLNASLQGQNAESTGKNVDKIISDHISYGREHNGEVLVDNATWEALTGQKGQSKNSVLIVDEKGNYQYGRKDENGNPTDLKPVPYDLAKAKLTKQYKSGLDKKYNNGETTPSAPKKEIKRSDIKSKASAAGYDSKEYEKLLIKNGVKIIE